MSDNFIILRLIPSYNYNTYNQQYGGITVLTRRFRIALCISIFAVSLFFVWNNILLLDDFHPMDDPSLQSSADLTSTTSGILQNDESSILSQQQDDNSTPESSIMKKGFHIHVNLDETRMYVYKNGELLKTYPVSGGKPSTPSPTGTWRIIHKDTWGEGFGGSWLGFNVPWGT